MAKIKQNVMGAFTGKVGTLTTYNAQAGNIARIRNNATNVGESASRTDKQQNNRVRWSNMVNFYKASKQWMKKAYEGKKKGISDYNRFMSVNFAYAKVALTKSEAAAGACVVESFLISQGSLAPIQVQKHGSHWDTNISLGTLSLAPSTTVAEVSAAIIANNNFVREGMQLSFISYQQIIDDLGVPRVICTPYEMLIDTRCTTEYAFDYLPDFCLSADGGHLCTSDNISVGAFAYVLSETVSGRTMVSTQQLITNNATLIAQYTDSYQVLAAIESYGKTADVFLDADNAFTKDATPQPLYIEKIVGYSGKVVVAKDANFQIDSIFDSNRAQTTSIVMSTSVEAAKVRQVVVKRTSNNLPIIAEVVRVEGRVIMVKGSSDWSSSFSYESNGITVNYDGTDYELNTGSGVSEIE